MRTGLKESTLKGRVYFIMYQLFKINKLNESSCIARTGSWPAINCINTLHFSTLTYVPEAVYNALQHTHLRDPAVLP